MTTRNARFQQWAALADNRTKRHRSGTFLVHGVRPISLAVDHGWPLDALLRTDGRLSPWARGLIERVAERDPAAAQYVVADDLLAELGGKGDGVPELVAVGRTRPDELPRLPLDDTALVVVLDRPASPGNVGTVLRSADAFGASGVVLCGHGADLYDPRTVRASTGSCFVLPAVQVPAPRDVLAWLAAGRARGLDVQVVGTDESGPVPVDAVDLRGPTVVVVGNEASGLSAGWRQACDPLLAIPIGGGASSLNAAAAATVVLYEAARQRGFPGAAGRPAR